MKVLVIHGSKFGNGQKVAGAICEGIREAGCEADMSHAKDIDVKAAGGYDLLVFGTPHRAGGPLGKAKKGVKKVGKASPGKPFTVFTTGADDKFKGHGVSAEYQHQAYHPDQCTHQGLLPHIRPPRWLGNSEPVN